MLLIDFKESEIEPKYLNRIKSTTESLTVTSSEDPNLSELLGGADAVLVKIFTKIDRAILDHAPNLKYIGVCSTAFDAIDVAYAKERGITMCNLGGYSNEAVAEFLFAALFERARELERAKQQARKVDFSFDSFMGMELRNKILGVIGAGRIGSRIAEIGIGIGMKVIYFSREQKSDIEKLGAVKKDLDAVLDESDFISLNLSLNKETEGIISKEKIDILKKNCIFINLSPPPLIDQEAMLNKTATGDITYIFDHSDDIDEDLAKRYIENKNCIVYPPIAFRTEEATVSRWETLVSNVENFIQGNLQNVVN